MSDSLNSSIQSKLLKEAQAKIRRLEEEVAYLLEENEELKKQAEPDITEYYYILDADEELLTGFFMRKLPDKS